MNTITLRLTGFVLKPFRRFIDDLNRLEEIFDQTPELANISVETTLYDDPKEGFAIESKFVVMVFRMNERTKRPDMNAATFEHQDVLDLITNRNPSNPLSDFIEIDILKELLETASNLIIPSQFLESGLLLLDIETIYNIKQELKSWLEEIA